MDFNLQNIPIHQESLDSNMKDRYFLNVIVKDKTEETDAVLLIESVISYEVLKDSSLEHLAKKDVSSIVETDGADIVTEWDMEKEDILPNEEGSIQVPTQIIQAYNGQENSHLSQLQKVVDGFPPRHPIPESIQIASYKTQKNQQNEKSNRELLKCDFCEKAFNLKAMLFRHKQTAHLNEPHKCNICPSTFRSRRGLRKHQRNHIFKCHVCSLAFDSSADLIVHKRIHTNELSKELNHQSSQPFLCKVCNKSFNQSRNLARHELIHTGSRPFSCRVCNKSFTQKQHLAQHELSRTHRKHLQKSSQPH